MKRITFIFIFCFISYLSWAQQKVQGFVYDGESKFRLAKVYIYNTRSQKGVMNSILGEFTLEMKQGDVIMAATEGYGADTITFEGQKAMIFKLKSLVIRLKEVTVKGIRKSPKAQYEERSEALSSALAKGNTNLLAIDQGAGISIDAIFSLLSKQGKNARILQSVLERDYRDAVIDYRFTTTLVKQATGLTDSIKIDDFKFQYRPSYYFILNTNEYDLINYIKMCFESYQRAPKARQPADLPKLLLPKP